MVFDLKKHSCLARTGLGQSSMIEVIYEDKA
jgi:hypothetical protein